MRTSTRALLGLHLLLALYSVTNIFSKLASDQPFMSPRFIVYYGAVLVILAIYALGWQQAIKRMPLTTAYANKAVTIVWGIVFGALFFGEQVTPLKVAGAALIVAGVVLFGVEDARYQQSREQAMNAQLAGPESGSAHAPAPCAPADGAAERADVDGKSGETRRCGAQEGQGDASGVGDTAGSKGGELR